MINLKIIKNAGFDGRAAPPDAGPAGPSRGKGKGGGIGGGKPGSQNLGPWQITFTGSNEAHPNTAPITGNATYYTMGADDGEDPVNNGDAYKIYNNQLSIKDQSGNWQAVMWELPETLYNFRIEGRIKPHISTTQGMQGICYDCDNYNPFTGDVMVFRGAFIRNYSPTTTDWAYSYNTSTYYDFRIDCTPTERTFYVNDVLQGTKAARTPNSANPYFGYMSWYTSGKAVNAALCEWIKVTRLDV